MSIDVIETASAASGLAGTLMPALIAWRSAFKYVSYCRWRRILGLRKPMGFYQNQIIPFLIDLAMRQRNLAAYRNRVVSAAEGRVLEIGIGSGRNLPFYSQR